MGVSESHMKDGSWRREGDWRMGYCNNNNSKARTKGHSKSGKPLPPPDKPSASDITHNSLVLSWNPSKHDGSVLAYTVEMCHVSDNRWLVLTYSCQGCLYQVRSLQADQIYMFRIRVENIYGTSKPSVVSNPVQTHTSDIEIQYHCKDRQPSSISKPIRRRHSFNVPLEGTVVNILNHSNTIVKSSSCLKNFTSSGTHSAESTFQRSCFRTSLEPCRKHSLSSLLPGSKTDSVSRMRDSYRRSNHSRSSLFTMQGVARSINDCRSDISCSARTSRSDVSVATDISKSDTSANDMNVDKRFSNTSDSQASSSSVDETDHSMDTDSCDVWEKKDQNIFKASLSDEIKLVLCPNRVSIDKMNFNDKLGFGQSDHWVHKSQLANENSENVKSSLTDFRTLRNMLHSADIFVKPNPFDFVDFNSNGTHSSHKLSTINDVEEEEFVRVTTL